MQPILGMRYDHPEQLKLALANYRVAGGYQLWFQKNDWRQLLVYYGRDVSTGRYAWYFSKKVKAKKQLFTESHDDANKVGERTSKEGEGSSRNSDVSPKWTKSKIVSSRKSGWSGYLRKRRKTKPKRQNRTRSGKAGKDKVKTQVNPEAKSQEK
ncbi:hypothetical protein Tco_1242572 [Tanacetum coccineum]